MDIGCAYSVDSLIRGLTLSREGGRCVVRRRLSSCSYWWRPHSLRALTEGTSAHRR
jgi:hypothetical protein